jgi:hypothetical protein
VVSVRYHTREIGVDEFIEWFTRAGVLASQSPFFHQMRQINEAIGEAPFVVVPCEDLDQLATDDQSNSHQRSSQS